MVDNQKYSIILPARIVEYFAETQTATVQICAEQIYNNSTSNQDTINRAPIEDVPVHTPSGGGWSMTMPIKAGDTCLMLFSQVGYEHWLYEDKDSAGKIAGLPKPWLNRQFHEDDGLAFVGFNTIPRAIKGYSPEHSEWRNEDATQRISLQEDLSITIDSPVSVTVNAPSVNINCETANMNVSASTTVNCPATEITGNVQIGGNLNVGGQISGASLNVDGQISGTNAVLSGTYTGLSYNGIIVESHAHGNGNNGEPTTPPL